MTDEPNDLDKVAQSFLTAGPPKEPKQTKRGNKKKPPSASVPDDRGYDVDEMNKTFAFVMTGGKSFIMREDATRAREDRVEFLMEKAFLGWHLNKTTEVLDRNGDVVEATYATRWLRDPRRREYRGVVFLPGPPGVTPDCNGDFNLWGGFSVKPQFKEHGYKTFKDHLLHNICDSDKTLYDYVFAFFAHMVQRPDERTGTALAFRGKQGTGKSKVGEVFGSLVKEHYKAISHPRYLVGNFNAHQATCLLLQADEAAVAENKQANGRLKDLVTSPTNMIERKGVEPVVVRNFMRIIFTSNDEQMVWAAKDERRWAVFDVNPRCAQNHEYFAEIDEEMENGGREALLHDLLQFDLSKVNVRKIPQTKALLDQKLLSLDQIDQWLFECLRAGTMIREAPAWKTQVRCDLVFNDYIAAADRVGHTRKSVESSVGRRLRELIPGLYHKKHIDTDGHRRPFYFFPSLKACREAFAEQIGAEIDWGDDDEDAEDSEGGL